MRLTASFSSVSTQFPAAVTICSLKLILWSHERLFLQGLGAFGKGLNISLLSTGLGLLQGTVESRNNWGEVLMVFCSTCKGRYHSTTVGQGW